MASNSTSFAISPVGQEFPRFAFTAMTRDLIQVIHQWTEEDQLYKRTDTLSSETAGQFIKTLRNLGYTETPSL